MNDYESLRSQEDLVDRIARFFETDENWIALKSCWLYNGRSDDLRILLQKAFDAQRG